MDRRVRRQGQKVTLPARRRAGGASLLSTAARRPRTSRRQLILKLDAVVRNLCLESSGGTCSRCGRRDYLQVHHVYSRSIVALRHDLDNLITLCGGCHLWWHHNPFDAAAWFAERFGQARQDRLILARRTRSRVDLEALLVALTSRRNGGGPDTTHDC